MSTSMPTRNSAAGPEKGTRGGTKTAWWVNVGAVFAAATAPFLRFVLANRGEQLDVGTVFTWWLVTLVVAVALLALASRFGAHFRAWAGTAIVLALYQLLSFPRDAITRLAPSVRVADLIWGFASLLLILLLWRFGHSKAMQTFVALVAIGLLAGPLLTLSLTGRADAAYEPVRVNRDLPPDFSLGRTPDVWFFILDGHANLDYFSDSQGYDPSPFEDYLAETGFQIQAAAESNYPLTFLSVASTMEMEYLYRGLPRPPLSPFVAVIQGDNETVQTFRSNGYAYVHAYPGMWSGTECSGIEDLCLGDQAQLNNTHRGLQELTPFTRFREDMETLDAVARANDPAAVVSQVLEAGIGGPTFSFVHVLTPHAPMLRGSSCEVRDIPLMLNNWESEHAYAEATQCLHSQLEEAVDLILGDDPDAVIVIQGDHGHRFGDISKGQVVEDDLWYETLSVIRLPPECDQDIPEDLTLVNTFRIVFGCLAGKRAELVPNERIPIRND